MPNWTDDDDGTCPGCGVYMEVIGPPGPRHSDVCPYGGSRAVESTPERQLHRSTQLHFAHNELGRYFDEVMFKHHGDDLNIDDDFEF